MVYVFQLKIAHDYLIFQGDLSVLRPTFMCGVPVMLDRIYKGVLAKIKAKGTFSYKLFEYAVDYRTLWLERGYDTPLFDKFLFRAVRDVTGGRLAKIIVGGAPLSGTTHQFVRSVRNRPGGTKGDLAPSITKTTVFSTNAGLRLAAVRSLRCSGTSCTSSASNLIVS